MNRNLLVSILSVCFLFSAPYQVQSNYKNTVDSQDSKKTLLQYDETNVRGSSKDEITLILEDFEGGDIWSHGPGWERTTSDYNSPSHSYVSPNNSTTAGGVHDLLSTPIDIPELGEGETMHFGFYLNTQMPDSDGNGDNYLEDYYAINVMDVDALAWHQSTYNDVDGNTSSNPNWWASDEEVGGYLDSWAQYLDTPPIEVGNGYVLNADLYWAIESFSGVSGVSGECAIDGAQIDGWDQANVQISTDGGSTFTTIEGNLPYDFQCGYGTVWNGLDGLPGWGDASDGWNNVSFDLSAYAGETVVVRFAFYSDPAFSTADDATITGFQVDNIQIGPFSDTAEADSPMNSSGAVWVEMFYDYGGDPDYDARPGTDGWMEYLPGYPFNGNAFLDISDFAGKTAIFRFQTRYDEDDDGGAGAGLFIDDFRIYKQSAGSYIAPSGLSGTVSSGSVNLEWADMNYAGQDEYIYDNDNFSNTISMVSEGAIGYAGTSFNIAGASTVNQVDVYNMAGAGAPTTICAFGTLGTLFDVEPVGCIEVSLALDGWNSFDVDWEMNGKYIISHTFSDIVGAALDESVSPSSHSYFKGSSGAWSTLLSDAVSSGFDGEWGIRATITTAGADVTYNVYQDGTAVQTGVDVNSATISGLENNIDYTFAISATYSDGEESDLSDSVVLTPFADTVHEELVGDGQANEFFTIGSGNKIGVRYTANTQGEDLLRIKWYQEAAGGLLKLHVYEDLDGLPGSEVGNETVAGGLVAGWNERDLSEEGWSVSGDFWVAIRSYSTTSPIGLDTDSSGDSYIEDGDWMMVQEGNFLIGVVLNDVSGGGGDGGGDCTPGDVNGDATINVLDIVTMVNFVMGSSTPSADESCAADVNGDDTINVLDIVTVVNIIMGN